MALQFGICAACGEEHAVRRDGRMSIHDTAAGERCPGPPADPVTPAPRRAAPPVARPNTRESEDTEFQRAVAIAGQPRWERYRRPETQPFDRRIYGTGWQQKLNGGLPGSGKRT